MMRPSRWWIGLSLVCACTGPQVGAVRDASSSESAVVDAVITVDASDANGSGTDVIEAGRGDADVSTPPDVPDVTTSRDVPDADVPDVPAPRDVPDADVVIDVPDTGVSVPDAGVRMTFTFVGGAMNATTSGGVRFHGVISWHGQMRGSNDAGVTFEAVLR